MTDERDELPARAPRRRAIAIIAPVVVLAAGAAASAILIRTAPQAQPKQEATPAKIVRTVKAKPHRERIAVHAHGTIIPVREVTIRPEVRGRVVRQHGALVPGGFIRQGDELIGIDRSDYEQVLVDRETALAEAQYELEVEKGRQVVASREWQLLEGELPESDANRSLVLREPHLRRAEALIRRAESQIAIAKLDLDRTSVAAPFNAVVLSESVEEGQLVEPGSTVATLVGTDEFWVQVSVPIDQLRYIAFPESGRHGAGARVFLEMGEGGTVERQGRVDRLLSDLAPAGRMARVLVSVHDPLGLESSSEPVPAIPLLLGSYVRVEIDAGELDEVLTIDRAALREGGRIWVADAKSELQIRDAAVLWPRPRAVVVANCLEPGDQIIVSGLPVALPGMKVTPRPLEPAIEAASLAQPEAP